MFWTIQFAPNKMITMRIALCNLALTTAGTVAVIFCPDNSKPLLLRLFREIAARNYIVNTTSDEHYVLLNVANFKSHISDLTLNWRELLIKQMSNVVERWNVRHKLAMAPGLKYCNNVATNILRTQCIRAHANHKQLCFIEPVFGRRTPAPQWVRAICGAMPQNPVGLQLQPIAFYQLPDIARSTKFQRFSQPQIEDTRFIIDRLQIVKSQ